MATQYLKSIRKKRSNGQGALVMLAVKRAKYGLLSFAAVAAITLALMTAGFDVPGVAWIARGQ